MRSISEICDKSKVSSYALQVTAVTRKVSETVRNHVSQTTAKAVSDSLSCYCWIDSTTTTSSRCHSSIYNIFFAGNVCRHKQFMRLLFIVMMASAIGWLSFGALANMSALQRNYVSELQVFGQGEGGSFVATAITNTVVARNETNEHDKVQQVTQRLLAKRKENILDKVVRKLLSKTDADKYIEQHPGNDFRFYVYDTLPREYRWDNISQCIEKRYKINKTNKYKTNATGKHCDWGSSICTDASDHRVYLKRRHNRNADVILAKIFANYQGPLRTDDPTQADLFIVPYPNAGHCECIWTSVPCGNGLCMSDCVMDLPSSELHQKLLTNLKFYNETTKFKHLFLSSIDWVNTHPFFTNEGIAPLVTTIGHRECREEEANCGRIVIPYANTNGEYQPGVIHKIAVATTSNKPQRHFALSAIMSKTISGNSFDRVSFFDAVENITSLNNRPFFVSSMHGSRSLSGEAKILHLYRNTTFCPCLRGDQAPQKRIFDAILSGCIPVVIEHKRSREDGWPSHFARKGHSIRQTYPFAMGTFSNAPAMGINYQDLVIDLPGYCGMDCLLPILKNLLATSGEDVIREKQENIEKVRSLLTYGMEKNALKHPDTVAAILVQARHYVLYSNQQANVQANNVAKQASWPAS